MKNRIAIMLCIAAITLLLSSCDGKQDQMMIKAAYMASSGEESIQLIDRSIDHAEGEALYRAVIETIIKSPNDERYTSVFPTNTTVEKVNFYDTYGNYSGVVVATMGGGYQDLEGIDKTIADYCIVMSICELEGVSGVVICCEQLPSIIAAKVMQPEDIIMNAKSLRTTQYTVSLWYPSAEKKGELEQTEKTVVATVDTEAAEIVFRALMSISTESDGVRFINSATNVLSVNIEKGICYLNLSEEFMKFFCYSPDGENLTVRAIVNSLCELEEVDAVQFVIDGRFVSYEENKLMSDPIEAKY